MATAPSCNTSADLDACFATFGGHAADIAARQRRADRRHSASAGTQDGSAQTEISALALGVRLFRAVRAADLAEGATQSGKARCGPFKPQTVVGR